MWFSWDAINPFLGIYLQPSGLADTHENNTAVLAFECFELSFLGSQVLSWVGLSSLNSGSFFFCLMIPIQVKIYP